MRKMSFHVMGSPENVAVTGEVSVFVCGDIVAYKSGVSALLENTEAGSGNKGTYVG